MVFETALTFDRIFKIEIPVPFSAESFCGVREIQPRQVGIGLEGDDAFTLCECTVQRGIGVREFVIAAKGDQRPQFEPAIRCVRLVLRDQRVFSRNQVNALLNLYAARLKTGNGSRRNPERYL